MGGCGGRHTAQLMRLRRLWRRWAAAGDGLHAVSGSRIRLVDGIIEMGVGVRMVCTGRDCGCRVLVMIVMLMGGVCMLHGTGANTRRIVVATTSTTVARIAVHAQCRRASNASDTSSSSSTSATVMVMSNAAEFVAQDA